MSIDFSIFSPHGRLIDYTHALSHPFLLIINRRRKAETDAAELAAASEELRASDAFKRAGKPHSMMISKSDSDACVFPPLSLPFRLIIITSQPQPLNTAQTTACTLFASPSTKKRTPPRPPTPTPPPPPEPACSTRPTAPAPACFGMPWAWRTMWRSGGRCTTSCPSRECVS